MRYKFNELDNISVLSIATYDIEVLESSHVSDDLVLDYMVNESYEEDILLSCILGYEGVIIGGFYESTQYIIRYCSTERALRVLDGLRDLKMLNSVDLKIIRQRFPEYEIHD